MSLIAVIGIGQRLRGDDGAGLSAVQLWEEAFQGDRHAPDLQVELAENPGVSLLDYLLGVDAAVLVDAIQSGAAAGTLYRLREEDLAVFQQGAASAHGWGVAETLVLGRRLGLETLPERIMIIGIEAGGLEVGQGLSQAVTAALPQAARLISETIAELRASLGE